MTSPGNGNRSSDASQRTGRTVVGLFRDQSEAEDAIRDLKGAGYTNEQIGVAMQDPGKVEELVEETATGLAAGATVGAVSGSVVGGLLGLLGSLLIPGLGPVVVGGVLASTLMGAGIGAATGGLIGALMGMGVPESDARHFDAGFREGGVLVTVTAPDGAPEALVILQRHGGDVGSSASETALAGRSANEDRATTYEGGERRTHPDESYSGPERRLVGV
jgi:heat induced stress protein YflT